jgi:hypothetical protein
MRNSLISILLISSLFIFTHKVHAADLTQQEPTLITIKIGTPYSIESVDPTLLIRLVTGRYRHTTFSSADCSTLFL